MNDTYGDFGDPDCAACDGTGEVAPGLPCPLCAGSGELTPDEED